MALLASVRQLGATVLALLQTRIELLAVELAEEKERLLSVFLLAFLAALFLGLGVLVVTAVVAVWLLRSYGFTATLWMAALYLLIGIALAWRVKRRVAEHPPLFSTSLAELNKDREAILAAAREPEEAVAQSGAEGAGHE
ncbi:phage holin family protein [Parvibium lacunae]|uniref:Phage holin family protein n=1 Tax=Parvibium lacunae TaxID=1888893 RepID=A0A368L1Z1_9BURK|nr:phage holin family protein [Parvibium lacunae]RCS57513.1 hypothetical protein DU000_08680 [Parvibium lacunae]